MVLTQFAVDTEKLEVSISRIIRTTPERLFQAHVDPELIPKWWGPAKYETVVEENDVRVGGKWRFVQSDDSGRYVFFGEYQEIDEPHKLVRTFEYEPFAGHVIVETTVFTDLKDGTTSIMSVSQFASLEDLQGMVQSGMEGGSTEGMERLAVLTEAPVK